MSVLDEQIVSLFEPMPHRYIFLPGQDTRIMTACRERARAAGRPVYAVLDARGEFIGVRVPHYILDPVIAEEARLAELREDVEALFPLMPAQSREAFFDWFESSWTGRQEGEGKAVVMRAVFAFVRRFEDGGLVKAGDVWRKACQSKGVEEVVREWGFVATSTKRRHRRHRRGRSLTVAGTTVSGRCGRGGNLRRKSLDVCAGVRRRNRRAERRAERRTKEQEVLRWVTTGGHSFQGETARNTQLATSEFGQVTDADIVDSGDNEYRDPKAAIGPFASIRE
ncbi:hypothetical protein F4861DRAFT_548905 [Xylaria intraflava]|nr:hypothetical protein F4861DRAFT_548905 [Xylaria intraflava]